MIEIKAPKMYKSSAGEISVFLAGSIEQGTAIDWQEQVRQAMASYANVVLYNPRRDNWDASLEQTASNETFNQQVNWELDHIETCDIVFMYFDPNTKSPITLAEFGQTYTSGKLIVGCPPGFWRRGNLEVMCLRSCIQLHSSLDDTIGVLKNAIDQFTAVAWSQLDQHL